MILQQKNQNQNYHRYKNNEQEMQQINQVGLLYILIILLIQIIIHNKEGAPCPLKSWNTVSFPTRRDARRAAAVHDVGHGHDAGDGDARI